MQQPGVERHDAEAPRRNNSSALLGFVGGPAVGRAQAGQTVDGATSNVLTAAGVEVFELVRYGALAMVVGLAAVTLARSRPRPRVLRDVIEEWTSTQPKVTGPPLRGDALNLWRLVTWSWLEWHGVAGLAEDGAAPHGPSLGEVMGVIRRGGALGRVRGDAEPGYGVLVLNEAPEWVHTLVQQLRSRGLRKADVAALLVGLVEHGLLVAEYVDGVHRYRPGGVLGQLLARVPPQAVHALIANQALTVGDLVLGGKKLRDQARALLGWLRGTVLAWVPRESWRARLLPDHQRAAEPRGAHADALALVRLAVQDALAAADAVLQAARAGADADTVARLAAVRDARAWELGETVEAARNAAAVAGMGARRIDAALYRATSRVRGRIAEFTATATAVTAAAAEARRTRVEVIIADADGQLPIVDRLLGELGEIRDRLPALQGESPAAASMLGREPRELPEELDTPIHAVAAGRHADWRGGVSRGRRWSFVVPMIVGIGTVLFGVGPASTPVAGVGGLLAWGGSVLVVAGIASGVAVVGGRGPGVAGAVDRCWFGTVAAPAPAGSESRPHR